MNSRLLTRAAGLLALATCLLAPALRADLDDSHATARARFSDPSKPGTLKFNLPWAEARITGTDGDEIVVSSSLDQKGRDEVDDDGFRRLDEDVTFELVEKNNVVVIALAGGGAWVGQGAEFNIKVPRNTNLVIRTSLGGDIRVDGVEGDLDINSMNGEIELNGIASSAIVNTLNGEIRARFKSAPVKPVSISSLNGEIDVHLPASTQANLRMRTHNGSIRTNFSDKLLQTKTVKNTADAAFGNRVDEPRDRREQNRLERERNQAMRDAALAAADAAKAALTASEDAISAAVEAATNANRDVDTGGFRFPPLPPLPPLPGFGGKTIVGTLNGGGVDIKLTSMNGTITLRQAE